LQRLQTHSGLTPHQHGLKAAPDSANATITVAYSITACVLVKNWRVGPVMGNAQRYGIFLTQHFPGIEKIQKPCNATV
jgi:hypothetical protein